MKRFEPGKIYFYRYLTDNPWYSYIILKCIKRTEKTAVFQRTNGDTYRGRLKPTWREDGERVKLDGWIYLESPSHEFRPGLEDCTIETVQEAEALFAGLDDPQPAQQPAPIIRLATSSAAPYAVLVDD